MLADKIRPKTLDDIVGQEHILAKDAPLHRIIDSKIIPNMIFYGPPGVGKTTIAKLIAESCDMTYCRLNGTNISVTDIKKIASESKAENKNTLLCLDEIQYMNKKQQQSLLECTENGNITLVATTTENPYFSVYNAILSRSTVFEFKPVSVPNLIKAVKHAFMILSNELNLKIMIASDVCETIAYNSGGDVRKAVNTAELCITCSQPDTNNCIKISSDILNIISQNNNINYDKNGDRHYDLLSAFQKSIRGSDENAALYYAAALIESGDIISLTRRLLVIAAEDVGLACPQAIVITKACVDTALQLGLPEARIPLSEAIIFLATAPKSNSAEKSIDNALHDVKSYGILDIPRHLQNTHCDGAGNAIIGQNYLYPHDYPNHFILQQYLPEQIKTHVYYEFGDNKQEQQALNYRNQILENII